ncbi:hypothetical protein [Streptomyces caatingaensis]|uniref:hypothetical protein n=1 Tax=Streptomyces caatingaensis TaxID=1678637 RepID=UPI000A8D960E|nr:hypothetical protein [Streptomyces caatingaensis]
MITRTLPLLLPYALCCLLASTGTLPTGVLVAVPVAWALYVLATSARPRGRGR